MDNQNKGKKLPACIGNIMKKGRFWELRKKKRFWAGILALGLVLVITAGLLFRGKASENLAAETTVQSSTASTGTISTTVVGTGTLAAGTATDVVVPVGIKVKQVLVESGDTVVEGQQLATLDEASIASELLEVNESIESISEDISNLSSDAQTAGTTEYLEAKVLNGNLEELKEAQTALNSLLESKVITASCAGTISSINVSADTQIMQSSGNTNSTTSGTSTASMSAAKSTAAGGTSSDAAVVNLSMTASVTQASMVNLTADTDFDKTDTEQEASDEAVTVAGESDSITIESCDVEVEAPAAGKAPQTEVGQTEAYSGSISWNCTTETFQEKTVYTATIKLTANEGYTFSSNILPEIKGADVTWEVLTDDAGASILRIKAKFAKTAAEENKAEENKAEETTEENNPSSENNGTAQENDSAAAALSGTEGSQKSSESESGMSSGSTGGSSGSGTSGSSASTASVSGASGSSSDTSSSSSVSSDYSAYEASAFSISSQSETVVSINVDELDILSVEKGQTAVVTLDALENQEFEGTITKVSQTASSGSSSAKYPVEITLEKTDDMKLGMTASATIQIEEAENAVLIPVNALQEKGNSTFVYTAADEDGNLTDEVEVETGLSNGSQVEITSGLSDGDTVYYLKSESSDNSGMSQDMMGGPGGEMPSGGGAPSGEMPSGGGGPGGGSDSSR